MNTKTETNHSLDRNNKKVAPRHGDFRRTLKNPSRIILGAIVIILLSAISAAAVSHWSPGEFWAGWLDGFILSLPFFFLLALAWHWSGRRKIVAVMILLAFALRVGAGLTKQNLLPIYGHLDEPRQQRGYLFDDEWKRDEEAWRIARENPSFVQTITRKYNNDQYGGMVALGIWIYQYISPDARRVSLVFLIGAFITALGLPFFWKALSERWDDQIAGIAVSIYALYPDSVFYSGAAMREPFLIGILAVSFWALCTLQRHFLKSIIILGVTFLLTLPFSNMVGLALFGLSIFWIWVEFLIPKDKKWQWVGLVCIACGILAVLIFALPNIINFIHFDIHTMENSSGWVEKVVGEIGGRFRPIFLAVYGITQPVLPAILVYPTRPFWKIAGILRAAGWYMMVPFLFYALFSTLRVKDKQERNLLIANAIFVALWIFASSLRAGGDQWDNPRYRTIFLPWLCFFCAWGVCFAKRAKDWWLVRWIAIEIIFLYFFTQWYISRYYADIIRRFPFWKTVVYILICSAAVFATGLIQPARDFLAKRKKGGKP